MSKVDAVFAAALRDHQAGHLEAAERRYRQVLAASPGHNPARKHLGLILLGRRRWAEAARVLDRPGAASDGETSVLLGVALAELGRLPEAVAAYRASLAVRDHPETRMNLGNALANLGAVREAEAEFRAALTMAPTLPTAHANLAALLASQGRDREALPHFRRAAALDPANVPARVGHALSLLRTGAAADALAQAEAAERLAPAFAAVHNAKGMVLVGLDRPDEALCCFRRALDLDRAYAEAWTNAGSVLRVLGRLDEAEVHHREAIRLRPDHPDPHANLGTTLVGLNRLEEAVDCTRRALALRPGRAELHGNLAGALRRLGRLDEAAASFATAAELAPERAEAHNDFGTTLVDLNRAGDALACYARAIALRPEEAEFHSNLATALWQLGRPEEAAASSRRALDLDPDHAGAHANLGNALQDLGQPEEAEACYRRAIAAAPDYADAHVNLGLLLLLHGAFAEGWREYAWRLGRDRPEGRPRWTGEPAEGRTILLWAEQGLGDTIQFIRYAPQVVRLGWRVVVEAPPPLMRLLRCIEGITLVAQGEPLPPFDLQCPLVSLAQVFATGLDTIPAGGPYLRPEPELVEAWRRRLPAGGRRIGLVWQGRPTNGMDRRRSIAPQRLAPLFQVPGLRFCSLQIGEPRAPEDFPLFDPMGDVGDLADTAAIIASLDLVISVDSAVAHLAAALGKPTWLLNRHDPDWRWLMDRDDSPWYPSLRQFRQRAPGDWDEVVSRVAQALAAESEA